MSMLGITDAEEQAVRALVASRRTAPAQITVLPPDSQATCSVCWRRAQEIVSGRLLCRQCRADEAGGSYSWLD